MSAPQITFALTVEGPSDLDFLSSLVQRAIETCVQHRYDADVLPCVAPSTRPNSVSFPEWMAHVQSECPGVSLYFVHQDCDAPNADRLHDGRWETWLERADLPDRWVPVFPCRAMESWLLADLGFLGQQLRLHSSDLTDLRQQPTVDNINDPKEHLDRLRRASLHRRPPRTAVLRQRMGENASFLDLTARSPSFVRFKDATCAAVDYLFQGQ